MTRCVLLLRGVNVGRANRIRMADLVALLEGAGCREVSTYLQSGNALVSTDLTPDAVAAQAERALAQAGLAVPVLARTADDLDDVVAAAPWPERDPTLFHVAFLSDQPDPAALAAVDPVALLPEELVARGRELYLWYAEGVQRSRLDRVVRRLGVAATARNWRTVGALRDLLQH